MWLPAMQRSLVGNIRWKALGILFTVWVVILACEIGKVGICLMSNLNPQFSFCCMCIRGIVIKPWLSLFSNRVTQQLVQSSTGYLIYYRCIHIISTRHEVQQSCFWFELTLHGKSDVTAREGHDSDHIS